jgi:subtilase family protein
MTPNEDRITTHVVGTDDKGLPFACQRNILRADPNRVDETLAEIQAIKPSLGSSLANLTLERVPRKQPGSLKLAGVELNALEVRDALNPALAGKSLRVQVEPAYLAGDPMLGMPAKHGHGIAREGINLIGVAPPARSAVDLEAGRRPVVAVLDTPVREHPWLGDGEGDDAFWRDARRVGDPWKPHFEVPKESANGRLPAAGHGTFIAGMVRLLAPDARVLSVPIMHGDAVVDEDHVISALNWLRDRVTSAAEGRRERFVDVVNLSFGRYVDPGEHARFREEASALLDELAQLGVRVVTSAGNESVADDVFPAMLSEDKNDTDHTPLVSVGALDPDGTPAAYTSTADWVTVQAPGSSLVSTLPDFDPSEYPIAEDFDDDGDLVNPDPNFQASGIGHWSVTSFAAGWVSASIAAKLIEQATPSSLLDTGLAGAGARAKSAWDAVVADLEDWIASHGVVD